jgi:hypothetical protein
MALWQSLLLSNVDIPCSNPLQKGSLAPTGSCSRYSLLCLAVQASLTLFLAFETLPEALFVGNNADSG